MRRARWAAALVVLLILAATTVVLLGHSSDTPLDPANPQPEGAEAVATVLSQQGVRVHAVQTPSALAAAHPDARATVLVPRPAEISTDRMRTLLRDHPDVARVVLIAPSPRQLNAVLGTDLAAGVRSTAAACALPWGHGLSLQASSRWYSGVPTDAATCFGRPGSAPVFELPAAADRPAVLVIGSAAVFRNETVDEGDNAAIALRSLGQSSELFWYSGGFDPEAGADEAIAPRWLRPAVWLLAISTLLLMFWRGRRMGKLVSEPLPVVVPANETTRARGQLYRKSRDSAAVAATLRAATRGRLAATLGLAPRTPPERLVDEVARATGRHPQEVAGLLLDDRGAPDTKNLPSFARELTTLERQARRS